MMVWQYLGWHCLEGKKLFASLREILSEPDGDNCSLNFFIFQNKDKLESHKKVCENKDFCNVVIPSEDRSLTA